VTEPGTTVMSCILKTVVIKFAEQTKSHEATRKYDWFQSNYLQVETTKTATHINPMQILFAWIQRHTGICLSPAQADVYK
jgi:hypothetical protein